ncbi:class I SAM-dependent methyltransferase, partial [Halorubrum sp. SS5]
MTDAFGRAIRDHHRGERTAPLRQGDGGETREHPIEAFYFTEFDPESDAWLASRLDGPLVDLGAGAGRHALRFQERFETVAVESSPALVETMRERGVADAREGDMFALREAFERDRFAAAIAIGTQIGLAGSTRGLSAFLGDLAFVTTPDATAVVDCYDPDYPEAADLLGYREDPTPGLAGRVMWFAYDGERDPTLRFTLFSPDRLREAAIGTGWTV